MAPSDQKLIPKFYPQLVRRPVELSAMEESRKFFQHDIGYEVIEQALELRCGAEDPDAPVSRLSKMLVLLQDPIYGARGDPGKQLSIGQMLMECHVTYFELMQVLAERYKKLHDAKKCVAILRNAQETMDDVIDDVAEDARSRTVACKKCVHGWIFPEDAEAEPVQCGACDGKGTIRKLGSPKALDLYFKMHGLDEKSGTGVPQQQINVNTNAQAGVKVESRSDNEPSVLTRVQQYIEKK